MTTHVQHEVRTRQAHQPPYKVLLHNDDHTPMDHVVRALVRTIPALSLEAATGIMYEAHRNGVALVTVAELEHAEFYQECLVLAGLVATIEPDA